MNPLHFSIVALLAFVGLACVIRGILHQAKRGVIWALRRWAYPRLRERHDRVCRPLNEAWVYRVVRHAPTGRIGLCLRVCTLESGWRDLFWPRWVGHVIFHPGCARVVWAHRHFPHVAFMATGAAMELVPLGSMTLAPAADAADFKAQLESEADA